MNQSAIGLLGWLLATMPASAQAPSSTPAAPKPFFRRASTGHVTNYDEGKTGSYALPDPLLSGNGKPVRDRATWTRQRRPELLATFATEIFGRVPRRVPRMVFDVVDTDPHALDGAATRKRIVGRLGDKPDSPKLNVVLHLPRGARRVPVMMRLVLLPLDPSPGRPTFEDDPISDILARGYGHAAVRVTDLEPDKADVIRTLALPAGQAQIADDEWGKTAAWAWSASRVLDHLTTDPGVDARRLILVGHSRFGRAALWAGAQDARFAGVFASCSGKLSTAISRRDYGQTIDDLIESVPTWFAGNLRKYAGQWNDLPIDSHTLIALQAPRPVFLTAGSQDPGVDPRGVFLAALAAEPVYRLHDKPGLGATELPPLDTPLATGSLGFLYHTGGHALLPSDWKAFLSFADRHLARRP